MLTHKTGFTLVETVFSLFLLLSLHFLMLSAIELELNYHHHLKNDTIADWGYFVYQLNEELSGGRIITNNYHAIKIENTDKEVITFDYYANKDSRMIRRRVNSQGHQPILMNVATFNVTNKGHYFHLYTKMMNGKEYELWLPKET
ncbi:competence type IV pilus minor pilin ComGF [Aerococcus suis]|uniref:Competence protein ComGF n=1 Tax=Aerococcus suis TaxID=371602 RepID=A0A1W1Y1Q2_9LACT|nr:competence type IV pilus minor pilin ComGF [Aerococcus suis]MCI7240705.1 ComGF family competence protein [Aerococcus suis]MDD7757895.1 competence type IV pilus minor pilin ComGF [Aerococcus suis]MDY4646853.1 competence type IV pilus minor pilin ComGF [Aerococcus suis]SMC30067.1 Competence protein ComGF [Aerococcus suis]